MADWTRTLFLQRLARDPRTEDMRGSVPSILNMRENKIELYQNRFKKNNNKTHTHLLKRTNVYVMEILMEKKRNLSQKES